MDLIFQSAAFAGLLMETFEKRQINCLVPIINILEFCPVRTLGVEGIQDQACAPHRVRWRQLPRSCEHSDVQARHS